MRLTFLGAARTVTGSCYMLEVGGMRLLVDCGLFQGKDDTLNREPFPMDPAGFDGVILTHCHIDHSARLPLLVKQGFRGPIYTHPATADLAAIMLEDSAHVQEMEVERANRKAGRAGRPLVEPLYSRADAQQVSQFFRPLPYGQILRLNDAVRIRLQDAGHILGSAMVEVFVAGTDGTETKILFSGDLGQPDRPILKDPAVVTEADYLIMESTYGNRLHGPPENKRASLADVLRSTVAKGGNVVIPAFAVGRTQELLYELNGLVESGKLPADLQVVLDSPLAIAATEITGKHPEVFDEATRELLRNDDNPFSFPGLRISATADDSKALNTNKDPLVIIAASGMCEGGRVVHHLKHNLWRYVSTVLFVGFQAQGTLGRLIADGATRVRIHGEEIAVHARIESLHGFSAHADQAQLLAWVDALSRPPGKTFLVHGEDEAQEALAALLAQRGHQVMLPVLGQSFELPPVGMIRRAPVRRLGVVQSRRRARAAVAEGAVHALSSRRMADLLRQVRALRRAWSSLGRELPPEQAARLVERADEALRALEEMRRLMGG